MSALGWSSQTVEECIERVAFPSALKLQMKDYRSDGIFPIIDQGQDLIAGWTDDARGVISSPLPLVLFGDHTRAFKFVDFPFVRGADGTQLLKPRSDIDPLFFFYACRAIDLPSRGYNRHFTLLKKKSIALPPRSEQADIAAALRRVEDAVELQARQLAVSEKLKRASMRELFSRGLRGEAQQETEIGILPETWEIRPIKELCEIFSGGTPRKSTSEYWNGGIPWASGKDLKSAALEDTIDHITEEGLRAGSRLAPADSILVLVRGMGLAKDLPISVALRPMAFNQDIKALVSQTALPGMLLRSAIYNAKARLLSRIVPSAHGTMTLNLDDIETFLVGVPPDPAEAKEIVAILGAVDQKIEMHRYKRSILDGLFETLLYKLIRGEIRVTDLDIRSRFEEVAAK